MLSRPYFPASRLPRHRSSLFVPLFSFSFSFSFRSGISFEVHVAGSHDPVKYATLIAGLAERPMLAPDSAPQALPHDDWCSDCARRGDPSFLPQSGAAAGAISAIFEWKSGADAFAWRGEGDPRIKHLAKAIEQVPLAPQTQCANGILYS